MISIPRRLDSEEVKESDTDLQGKK